jgi:hypothetical protein
MLLLIATQISASRLQLPREPHGIAGEAKVWSTQHLLLTKMIKQNPFSSLGVFLHLRVDLGFSSLPSVHV